jgi:hypothetical protein
MGVGKCPVSRILGRMVLSNVGADFKRCADSGHGGRAANVFTPGRHRDVDGNSGLEWPIGVEPAL